LAGGGIRLLDRADSFEVFTSCCKDLCDSEHSQNYKAPSSSKREPAYSTRWTFQGLMTISFEVTKAWSSFGVGREIRRRV
jgi:hypothetical protein